MAEYETIRAADADILLAGKQLHANGFRHPPLFHQFGLGPRLEHNARWRVKGSRDDEFAVGRAFDLRATFGGCDVTFFSCVHQFSPFVLVLRRPYPVSLSAHPKAVGTL